MVAIDSMIFHTPVFWFGLALVPFTALLADIAYKVVSRTCFKSLADHITELEMPDQNSQTTMLGETARLIRTVFDSTKRLSKRKSARNLETELAHGFAFSQEENGAVNQSDLIRAYDTTKSKPTGMTDKNEK